MLGNRHEALRRSQMPALPPPPLGGGRGAAAALKLAPWPLSHLRRGRSLLLRPAVCVGGRWRRGAAAQPRRRPRQVWRVHPHIPGVEAGFNRARCAAAGPPADRCSSRMQAATTIACSSSLLAWAPGLEACCPPSTYDRRLTPRAAPSPMREWECAAAGHMYRWSPAQSSVWAASLRSCAWRAEGAVQ